MMICDLSPRLSRLKCQMRSLTSRLILPASFLFLLARASAP